MGALRALLLALSVLAPCDGGTRTGMMDLNNLNSTSIDPHDPSLGFPNVFSSSSSSSSSGETAYVDNSNATEESDDNQLWPQGLIIGAQKGATTSVFDWLSTRVNITCGLQVVREPGFNDLTLEFARKETHFFNRHGRRIAEGSLTATERRKLQRLYLSYFEGCDAPLRMEATPNYLEGLAVPAAMYALMPEKVRERLRLVVVLREPIHRLVSWYNHQVCRCQPDSTQPMKDICKHHESAFNPVYNSEEQRLATLEEWFDAHHKPFQSHDEENLVRDVIWYRRLRKGLYQLHLSNWLQYFRREQILILNFETLVSSKPNVRRDALQRLAAFLLDTTPEAVGRQYSQHPELFTLDTRNKLSCTRKVTELPCAFFEDYSRNYEPYNRNLYALVNSTMYNKPPQEPMFRAFREGSDNCVGLTEPRPI